MVSFRIKLALSLTFLSSTFATPFTIKWSDFEVKHSLRSVPRGWHVHRAASPDDYLNVRIALRQDKGDDLVKRLHEVSNPASDLFRKHLSKEEVEALIAPHRDTVEIVDSWLESHGIDLNSVVRSAAGDWLSVNLPVAQVESMLDAVYHVYNHESGSSLIRTRSYSLPRSLKRHIDYVGPTTFFARMHERAPASSATDDSQLVKRKETSFINGALSAEEEAALPTESYDVTGDSIVPASCDTTITPACLRGLYNTASYVPAATDVNKIGISGYLDQYAIFADLQTFFTKYRTDAVGANFSVELVNGGQNLQDDAGVEANLDIQYTEGLTFPTPNIYYSTGGSPPYIPDDNTPTNTNEPYIDWLNYILSETSIPQTFTTSYGDDEQTVPYDYAVRVCNAFAQLGARGSSVLFSSGDFGVGGGDCLTNDGTNQTRFQPIFPSTCPYVTSVGGTILTNPEIAVNFSQGGFSNYFAQPDYQSAAVSTFLGGIGDLYSGLYNASGRGFPDVSAQGDNFAVVINGTTYHVGGTSASSPTFASVISLLNDYLLSQGKATLGFLNPWLYSTGYSGLNDIVAGSNPGCGTAGFTATVGWDPVTGLGTPDFVRLQALV